jgi:hypothetical protein
MALFSVGVLELISIITGKSIFLSLHIFCVLISDHSNVSNVQPFFLNLIYQVIILQVFSFLYFTIQFT